MPIRTEDQKKRGISVSRCHVTWGKSLDKPIGEETKPWEFKNLVN